MHMFRVDQDQNELLSKRRLNEHKLRWRKTGDWMDTAKPEDDPPTSLKLEFSTTEKRLIKETIFYTTKKRKEIMAAEWRVIEPNEENYRWSDLIGYPDVQKSIKDSIGFSNETWIDGALPVLLRLRPSSMIIRQIQAIEKMHKTFMEGAVEIGLQTLENSLTAQHENYKKRRSGKTEYPRETIIKAVSMYRANIDRAKKGEILIKTLIYDIQLLFSNDEKQQPSSKQIKRWVDSNKY